VSHPGEEHEKRPLPDLRIGDVERNAVVERLHAALAEGRLTLEEFDERSAAAYAARTAGDLEPLTSDLPTPTGPAAAPAEPARFAASLGRWRQWAGVGIILVTIWAITSLAAGEPIFFWPMFPLGIWGAVILVSPLLDGGKKGGRPDTRRS
jgi:hypothetical protein